MALPERLHPDDIAEIARLLARELRDVDDATEAEFVNVSVADDEPSAHGQAGLARVPAILPGQLHATLDQLAVRYGVSVIYMRRHQHELPPPRPLSPEASNSQLRFEVEGADEWWRSQRRSRGPQPVRRAPRRGGRKPRSQTHTPSGVPLLEVI